MLVGSKLLLQKGSLCQGAHALARNWPCHTNSSSWTTGYQRAQTKVQCALTKMVTTLIGDLQMLSQYRSPFLTNRNRSDPVQGFLLGRSIVHRLVQGMHMNSYLASPKYSGIPCLPLPCQPGQL